LSSSTGHVQVDSTNRKGASRFSRALSAFLTVALLMLPATDVAAAASPTPETLEQVNELLEGKVAFIELTDGRTIKKVKKVVVEPNFTYWNVKGKEEKIETKQVVRIRARSKSKGLIGLGAGAATGALLALATNSGETTCNEIGQCTADATSEQLGALTVLGAVVGFGVGKAIPRKQRIVYEAQGSLASDSGIDPREQK